MSADPAALTNAKQGTDFFQRTMAMDTPPVRSNDEHLACPLCRTGEIYDFSQDKRRRYRGCRTCGLVFVPSREFLSREEEKKRYDLHQNSSLDPDYRSFLSRLFVPLQECLAPGSSGLDFGSGPEPTLSRMFEEAGHSMMLFDQFYAPAAGVLEKQYDFITASEVVEHLREPDRELERLWACLKPGGRLGIMTSSVVGQDAFARWHYKNDPTHVCFFSPSTFSWLANKWDANLAIPHDDVFLFRKKIVSSSPRTLASKEMSA
jgi:SAM-dependent methyltransferase